MKDIVLAVDILVFYSHMMVPTCHRKKDKVLAVDILVFQPWSLPDTA
jgi:hypothetical protein